MPEGAQELSYFVYTFNETLLAMTEKLEENKLSLLPIEQIDTLVFLP